MAEANHVLWTLDNEIQPRDFERLCIDLLGREGFRHIEPNGGTKDNGKDAEIWYWRGVSDQRSVVAFQFSLEKQWERKLCGDISKIATNCANVVDMVFVTSQKVTGAKKDKLKKELKSSNGWELTIYDREWLRHRLTEQHQDLAKKYLGLDLPPTTCFAVTQLELSGFDETSANEIFQQTSPELLKAAILQNTRKEPLVVTHWYNLARFEYLQRNYSAALEAINKALHLDPKDKMLKVNMVLCKGTILAEKGLEERSRPLLIQAKEIFTDAVNKFKRPQDFYNLANVLGALGETRQAGHLYAQCVKLKPDYAQAWKNFGSLFVEKRRPEWGIECFDKALKLIPDLVEAHISKATALLIFFKKTDEAIQCFQTAYKIMPELDRKWKYCRYWFSRALQIAGRGEEALKQIEIELAIRPGDNFLLNQKAAVLNSLRKENPAYEENAFEFFKFRAHAIPEDYSGLAELIEIFIRRGKPADAWDFIDTNLTCKPFSISEIARKLDIPVGDFRMGFQNARLYKLFRRRCSVEDHLVTLCNNGLSPSRSLIPALNYTLMVPFAIVAHRLRTALERKESADIQAVFTEALNIISRIFPSFGCQLLAEAKPSDTKQQTDMLTAGMLILWEIVIAETARIVGFLAAKCHIPQEVVQESQNADWKKVGTQIAVGLLEQVGKEWQMTKQK